MKPKPLTTRPTTSHPTTSPLNQSMRLSLTSSMMSASKYPRCQYKKQHDKQLLNLICLTETCKNRGPICAMCRASDHGRHMVVPMRKFLGGVQECLSRSVAKSSNQLDNTSTVIDITNPPQKPQPHPTTTPPDHPHHLLHQITTKKQKMLQTLAEAVHQIAQQIRQIQQRIIQEANQAIEEVESYINLSSSLGKIVSQLEEGECCDGGLYRLRVGELLGMVRCGIKDTYEINNDRISKINEKVIKMSQSFITNLQQWSAHSLKCLHSIFEHNPNSKPLSDNTKQKQKQKQPPIGFKFSQQQKIKSIALVGNKSVKLTEAKPGFALLLGPSLQEKTIKFKIVSLTGNIMLGAAFKDIIKKNQYKFTPSVLGHGSYLVSNNSVTYSHHNKAQNMAMKGFSFTIGQQITMIVKGESLTFIKKSDPKSVVIQLMKMTELEWKQLVGCVVLNGVGDRVEVFE